MLYFDYNPRNVHYGTIRQQIWTLLHFPFHLAIVLTVEGLRQLTTWHGMNSYISTIFKQAEALTEPTLVAEWFQDQFYPLYEDGNSKTVVKGYENITANIDSLVVLASNNATSQTGYPHMVNELLSELLVGIAEYYGVKVPKPAATAYKKTEEPFSEDGPLGKVLSVFNLVYEYFFVSLGCIFLLLAAFTFLVRRNKDIHDYLAIGIRVVVGLIFFGMVGLYTAGDKELYYDYLYSPWPIPQVCLIIFIGIPPPFPESVSWK